MSGWNVLTVLLHRMPISYYVIGVGIQFILLVGIRFSFRFIQILKRRSENATDDTKQKLPVPIVSRETKTPVPIVS